MIEKFNKLSIPAGIILASIIFGFFIYYTQLNKQKSIEKQQQIEIQANIEADQTSQQSIIDQNNLIITQRKMCAEEALITAVTLYCKEIGCSKTEPIAATYYTEDYDYAYNFCLQSIGL